MWQKAVIVSRSAMGRAAPGMNRYGALLASEYQASVRPLFPHRKSEDIRAGRILGDQCADRGKDRKEMIEMAALGLLLMLVVIAAVVYIAGVAWLARLDVRQDESPPPETINPKIPHLRS
jgi:hypothetical protein